MTTNIKKSLIIVTLIFITNLSVFSQKIIFDSVQGGTVFCLNKTQSQFLIERYYKAQELIQTVAIKDTIMVLQDSTISYLDRQNTLLRSNIKQTKNTNVYLQEQLVIKDDQLIKSDRKNKIFKKSLLVAIPLVIVESAIIYLQNK